MAKVVSTVITDDLDGSAAAEVVSFSIDGAAYEIDLGSANRERLQKVLQPFIDGGRRVGRKKTARKVPGPVDTAAIRTWAQDQGLQVAERGRISADLVGKYNASH